MSDLTTGRIPGTPADLQQPLPVDQFNRPVANRETSRETSTPRLCDKGAELHLVAAHGRDGHEFPHNPWSVDCVKRLPNEPCCPDARCMTCDGARP